MKIIDKNNKFILVKETLKSGKNFTADLGGTCSTKECTNAIIANL